MIIYYSMIVWIALVGITYSCTRQQPLINLYETKDFRVPTWCVVAVIGYIVFWVALRTRFVDTSAYISMFNIAGSSLSDIPATLQAYNKMPGYFVFQVIVKSLISSNYHVFFLLLL